MAMYTSPKVNTLRFTTQPSKEKMLNQQETDASSLHIQQEGRKSNQLLLTIPQVAHQLGVSRAHVYKLINQGLPTIHLGRSVRVSMTSLQLWLNDQEM